MKTRQDNNSYLTWLPFYNSKLLKSLIFILLFSNNKSNADNDVKYSFFRNTFCKKTFNVNPCVQASPGKYLSVIPGSIEKYKISHFDPRKVENIESLDSLEEQLKEGEFIGDVFCNGTLEIRREERFKDLSKISFLNQKYSIDFNNPDVIEITLKNNFP